MVHSRPQPDPTLFGGRRVLIFQTAWLLDVGGEEEEEGAGRGDFDSLLGD